MAGPLVDVGTITRKIGLDISRTLNLGDEAIMELLVPDQDEPEGFRVTLTIIEGFDRTIGDEQVIGDGQTVVYELADENDEYKPFLEVDDLYIRVAGDTNKVDRIRKLAPNEARVYTITCNTRTLRNAYFANR